MTYPFVYWDAGLSRDPAAEHLKNCNHAWAERLESALITPDEDSPMIEPSCPCAGCAKARAVDYQKNPMHYDASPRQAAEYASFGAISSRKTRDQVIADERACAERIVGEGRDKTVIEAREMPDCLSHECTPSWHSAACNKRFEEFMRGERITGTPTLVPGDEGYIGPNVRRSDGWAEPPPPEPAQHFVLAMTGATARAWWCASADEAERMQRALEAETGLLWRYVRTQD